MYENYVNDIKMSKINFCSGTVGSDASLAGLLSVARLVSLTGVCVFDDLVTLLTKDHFVNVPQQHLSALTRVKCKRPLLW